jgi:hypothetical protein
MKLLGGRWTIELYDYMKNRQVGRNGFKATDIIDTILNI